ncbi:MAG: energy-coupling factor transporter transmembrane component T family protein [Promethearchaeota archaeon]
MKGHYFTLPFRKFSGERPQVSPATKVVLMIAFAVAVVANTNFVIISLTFIFALVLAKSLKGRILHAIEHSWVAIPVLFSLGIFNTFSKGSADAIITTFQFLGFTVNVYQEGLRFFALIMLRGICAVLIITTFTSSMTMQEFVDGLRDIRLPETMVSMIMLILRYAPLIFEEAATVRTAQTLRGLNLGTKKSRFTAAAAMLGMIFIRSYDRGLAVYESMSLRGLKSKIKFRKAGLKKKEYALLAACIILCIAIWIMIELWLPIDIESYIITWVWRSISGLLSGSGV